MRAALLLSDRHRGALTAPLRARPDLIVVDGAEAGHEAVQHLVLLARREAPRVPLFIRIKPLAAGGQDQLAPALALDPDGIWLGDTIGRAPAEQLASRLAVAEAELGRPDGRTGIVASVEGASGALAVSTLAGMGPRLAAISCDLASLARDIGCERGPTSRLPEPLRLARGSVILAAAAARVPAIDSPADDACDLDAFAAEASQARRDGFAAKLALDLDQVEVLGRLARDQAPLGRWMENFVSGVATK